MGETSSQRVKDILTLLALVFWLYIPLVIKVAKLFSFLTQCFLKEIDNMKLWKFGRT